MQDEPHNMSRSDKILFTPGPLTTSMTVKQAMLSDLGSRDARFIQVVKEIREELLSVAGASDNDYAAIPMQGSGTFGIESVISSSVPPDGKLAVIVNGAYGRRIGEIASILGVETVTLTYDENTKPNPDDVAEALATDRGITHVALVHCETTTGMMNPVCEIGDVVKKFDRVYLVDAMSSFGAVPLKLHQCGADYAVSSANKCMEGVPGFSFVLARISTLLQTQGYARSLSLDLFAQWRALEDTGQFRFTPPTHVLLAFRQALDELRREGGVQARAARYQNNHRVLIDGMREIGFQEYLPGEDQGYIITSFLYPPHPNFVFDCFYQTLSDKGFVIYPGKVSDADCFRIGTIGRIGDTEIQGLLSAIRETLAEMGVEMSSGR